MKAWRRIDVELGHRFVSPGGLVYRVVAIADDPVVVLVPDDERDGEDQEHHVISSLNFAGWQKIQYVTAGGSTTTHPPGE